MQEPLDIAKAVFDRNFALACPDMEIRSTDLSRAYLKGSGGLTTDKQGRLVFELHGQMPSPVPDCFLPNKERRNADLMDQRVVLVAKDKFNTEWRSSPIHVVLGHPSSYLYGIVRQQVPHLIRIREVPGNQPGWANLLIAPQVRLPFDGVTHRTAIANGKTIESSLSTDFHEMKIGTSEVTFRLGADRWTEVTCVDKLCAGEEWCKMMEHTLSFATSRDMRSTAASWTLEDMEFDAFTSGPFHRGHSTMRSVVSLRDASAFWMLVDKFFLFMWNNRASPLQILDELDAVRAAMLMPFQTNALALAVAVEAIAREMYPELGEHGWDRTAKADLEKHIKDWSGDQATKNRVLGWLGGASEPSARARLGAWAKLYGADDRLLKHWSKLRNPRAHGQPVAQEWATVDNYHGTVQLLFEIIATVIGFDPSPIRQWCAEPP